MEWVCECTTCMWVYMHGDGIDITVINAWCSIQWEKCPSTNIYLICLQLSTFRM